MSNQILILSQPLPIKSIAHRAEIKSIVLLESILQTTSESELLDCMRVVVKEEAYSNYLVTFPKEIGIHHFICHRDQAHSINMSELGALFEAASEHQYNLRRKSAVMEYECEKMIMRTRFRSMLLGNQKAAAKIKDDDKEFRVSLIAASICSRLSEKRDRGFVNHTSHIDVFSDVAQVALYAEACAQYATTDVGQAIKTVADTMRVWISQLQYSTEAMESFLRLYMHVLSSNPITVPIALAKYTLEAESAAAMASNLWDLSIADDEQVVSDLARFAVLSAKVYREAEIIDQDIGNLGVWMYDVDAEFGKYFVEEIQSGTYSFDKAKMQFGKTVEEFFQQEPSFMTKFDSNLRHLFEEATIAVC